MVTPGTKITREQVEKDQEIDPSKTTLFRASAARGNYLSADRIDIIYATKEICRGMSCPMETSIAALKRLGRYLEGKKRVVYVYPRQRAEKIEVYTDIDWAGCIRTR